MNKRKLVLSAGFLLILFTFLSCNKGAEENTNERLIKKIVQKYNRNMLKQPYAAKASYLEKAKYKGTYCMFTEGYGYLVSSGYNCPIPVDNFSFLIKNIRKSDRKKGWLATLKNTYKDFPVKSQTDLPPGYNSLFSAFRFFEKNGPLNPKKFDSFTFSVEDSKKAADNDTSSTLKVIFKSVPGHTKGYSGTMVVDKKSSFIKQVKLNSCRFYSENFRKWISAKANITYSKKEGNYYLKNAKFHFNKSDIEYWIQLVSSSPKKIDSNMTSPIYSKMALNDGNPFVIYHQQNWDNYEDFTVKDYKKIKKQLAGKNELDEQFNANASHPFYTATLPHGDILTVRGGKETYNSIKKMVKKLDVIFND